MTIRQHDNQTTGQSGHSPNIIAAVTAVIKEIETEYPSLVTENNYNNVKNIVNKHSWLNKQGE